MCPLTHIYISTKVAGRESPLLIIGSVLPDFVWMSRKLPSEKIHDNPRDFYEFVQSTDKDMLDLALGMMLHSNAKGADDYSHFYKGGYAMTKGKRLIKDLRNLFKSKDEKLNLYKAHNFIEAALDLYLLKNNPDLNTKYKEALRRVDIKRIESLICDFSYFDKNILEKDLESFFKIFGPKSVSSEKTYVSNFFPPILEIAYKQKVPTMEISAILNKAKKLTEEDWEELIEMTIKRMKIDFANYI